MKAKKEDKPVGQEIRFGGRRFRVATDTTLRQDGWLAAKISAAGVGGLDMMRREGENAVDFATRMVKQTIESGLATQIVAGMLVDQATPPAPHWTPEYADEIANFLNNLTSKEDKQEFNNQLASLVAGFFVSALRSQMNSQRSLSESVRHAINPNAAH